MELILYCATAEYTKILEASVQKSRFTLELLPDCISHFPEKAAARETLYPTLDTSLPEHVSFR